MPKLSLPLMLAVAIANLTLPAYAKTTASDPYQDIKAQAEYQGEVSVIVTLGSTKPLGEMLSTLQSSEAQDETPSYTAQQDAFMGKLGNTGVLSYQYFDETPSITLKLTHDALKRLLKIKGVVSIVTALGGDLF